MDELAPRRDVPSVYEAVGGEAGMLALADAWHQRVLVDELTSHPFEHGVKADHTARLAAYWTEALGGPAAYTERFGTETDVVRIHSGNGTHEDMTKRAIECFDQALADTGLGRDERLRQVLHDYFAWASWGPMGRYPDSADDVPEGLSVPKWSWDGPVEDAATPERPRLGPLGVRAGAITRRVGPSHRTEGRQ